MIYRTNNLGELRIGDVGKTVTLSGWVDTVREHKDVVFIDLRDREGKTQLVISSENATDDIVKIAKKIKQESVIKVTGRVCERGSKNPNMPTGDIEVAVSEFQILNACDTLPFQVSGIEDNLNENTRLKYRYLDIRRERMRNNLKMRHKMIMAMRNYMDKEGFLDVDTPILTKSTPEGARDFLVPSRTNPGEFFALPQSPQLFKQILMIAGIERYFQIAKCFRDEDLRADRQPEFTQLDIEMSFVTMDDVMDTIEGLAKYVFTEVTGEKADYDFQRMEYSYAMENYGSDKPDIRFDVLLKDITEDVKGCGFKAFADTVSNGGIVKAICIPNAADKFSRKLLGEYENDAKVYFGAKGLANIKIVNGVPESPIAKFLDPTVLDSIVTKTGAKNNDIILIVADKAKVVHGALGALRLRAGREFNLYDKNAFKFLWVVHFPMFSYDEEEQRYKAEHHPFTSIMAEDMEAFLSGETEKIRTETYDMVLNGFEIGGGSIRIFNPEIQSKVFDRLGLTLEQAKTKFGFFLEAFKYGAPPHGGLAFGIDRWLMVMLRETSIRDVIPFPKTNKGQCLMTDAPSGVDEDQLEELYLTSTYDENQGK